MSIFFSRPLDTSATDALVVKKTKTVECKDCFGECIHFVGPGSGKGSASTYICTVGAGVRASGEVSIGEAEDCNHKPSVTGLRKLSTPPGES